jgi:hypothetical protein
LIWIIARQGSRIDCSVAQFSLACISAVHAQALPWGAGSVLASGPEWRLILVNDPRVTPPKMAGGAVRNNVEYPT